MSDPARHDESWGELPRMNEQDTDIGASSRRTLGRVTAFPVERELPEHATPSELGAWPPDTLPRTRNRTAERAGTLLGTAACRIMGLREQLLEHADNLREQFAEARANASDQLRGRAEDLQATANRDIRQIRSRAQFLAHRYPIQFVLGSAGTAFAIGLVLGWWREDRE